MGGGVKDCKFFFTYIVKKIYTLVLLLLGVPFHGENIRPARFSLFQIIVSHV